MRVCLVSFSGFPDQGATYFYEMSYSLQRLGVAVDAIAVQRPGEAMCAVEGGVHVTRVPMALTMNWASPARWARKLLFFVRVAAAVRRRRYDIVHVYSTLGVFVLPLLAGRRPKWVHELQTGAVSSRSSIARWLQNRTRGLQGRAFDANLTVTKLLGERVFGHRASSVDTVPAGVNLAHFRPGLSREMREEFGVPADAVVRAFARALGEDGRLWLLMPGKGRQLEDLRRLAQRLDVAPRVWLPGYVAYSTLPRVFAAADAGLSYLPAVSYYDGQPPMKVMEYLAAALPVIVSDVSSHRVFVRHEENGLLAGPGEVGYAEAMRRFAAEPELRRRLGASARSSVSHLSYDRIATDRLLPVYHRLLEQHG